MSDAFIVCSNLSFSWPDDTPVFADLSFAVPGGRTGLVAPNGAGKSTLLRLIAGELRPAAAASPSTACSATFRRHLPLSRRPDRRRGPRRRPVIAALHAVESGDAGEEHFTADRRRLGHRGAHPRPAGPARPGRPGTGPAAAHPQRRPGRLPRPGGATAAAARRAAARRTDQQPRPGRPGTGSTTCSPTGTAACCWSATTGPCSTGWTASPNWTAARSASTAATSPSTRRPCAAEREVAEKNIRNAEQEVKREKRELQQARERAARRASTAARNLQERRPGPDLRRRTMKRNAQESAGKAARDARRPGRRRQGPARRGRPGRCATSDRSPLELPDTTVPAGRTVFLGERLQAALGDRDAVRRRRRRPDHPGAGADRADRSQRRRQVHPAAPDQRRPGTGRRAAQAGRRPGRVPVAAAGPARSRPHGRREPGRVRPGPAGRASG